MFVRLLLLGACVCTSLSADFKSYGDTYRMLMLSSTATIEFIPTGSSDVTVLWRHDDPPAKGDARRKERMGSYVIYNVTQRDNGRYVMRDKAQNVLRTKTLDVVSNTKSYHLQSGERIHFIFSLEPRSCNIYFFPEDEMGDTEYVLYRQGSPEDDLYMINCPGIELLNPCGISNISPQSSCSGRYDIRDNNGDLALKVFLFLKIESIEFNPSYIGYGIAAFISALSCCCCLRRCCCGKSSEEKDSPETPDAEPAVYYHGNDTDPGQESQQFSQPSQTLYPAQPSYTPTEPLIHNPPSYSQVVPAPEQTYTPTVPVPSEAEPKFELKGMTFPSAPPLSSESSFSHVYNSDKLNFL